MNVIILIGPPGSGKGTQCYKLSKYLNYHHISVGNLLRTEVDNNTAVGQEIRNDMNAGRLPNSNTVLSILSSSMKDIKCDGVILDGIPRNEEQVTLLNNMLSNMKYKIQSIILLNVSNHECIKRLLTRYMCNDCHQTFSSEITQCHYCNSNYVKKRSDDNKKTILNRLRISNIFNESIIRIYDNELIININGEQSEEFVFRDIISSLS